MRRTDIEPRLSKKPKFFYGYWIVVATFFFLFIFSGCGFFAFSLFVRPLQADLGWGRGEIMAAFTIYHLAMGIAAPFVGRVIDRYGARKVIAVGALIAGLGFVLLSLMNTLWHFYASYIIIGVGMTMMGHIPSSAVVSNWFRKRRGTAIGIMSTGIGAGGFALSPLVGGYLIPSFGWKVTYLALATLTCVVIIPLALLVIRTKPADMALYPDGVEDPEAVVVTEASTLTDKGFPLKMALATSGFWLIALSFLTGGFSQVGIIQNQVPYLEDIGFPVALAAGALGSIGLGSLVGKLVFGWLCDRILAKYAWSIGLILTLVSIIILMGLEIASPPIIIWLYVVLMGLSAGAWLPSMSMLISSNFGLANYGTLFGAISLFHLSGSAIGPLMAGYMYDTMGTYHWAFIILLAFCAVAIPTILLVRRPKLG
jgi:MFS family permease